MSTEKKEIIGLMSNIPTDIIYDTRRQMVEAAIKNIDEPTLALLACGLCKTHECERCALEHRVTNAAGEVTSDDREKD